MVTNHADNRIDRRRIEAASGVVYISKLIRWREDKKNMLTLQRKKKEVLQLKIISPSGVPKGSILEGRYLF